MSPYLFTDKDGFTLKIKHFGNGKYALAYREHLEKMHGEAVIVWAHMGGDNPDPTI